MKTTFLNSFTACTADFLFDWSNCLLNCFSSASLEGKPKPYGRASQDTHSRLSSDKTKVSFGSFNRGYGVDIKFVACWCQLSILAPEI